MSEGISAVLFDFGGVIADEGFHDGLLEIGRRNNIDPRKFFLDAERIIADSGYLTGGAGEAEFWEAVRRESGIRETDRELRETILRRFFVRPAMLDLVDRVRRSGATAAMLSDQTSWLEEIDGATGLFRHFDAVFNSFQTGKSKRDASVFDDVCEALGVRRTATLFVDDNSGHIGRAHDRGLRTLLFTTEEDCISSFRDLWPLLGRGIDKSGPSR